MIKTLKTLGITILLILIVIACLPFLFKDKLLDITRYEINNQINAKTTFGKFGVSIFSSFPNLKITIEDVAVVGVETFANDTLLNIKDFSSEVDIMSVIRGSNIKITTLIVDGITIHAKVLGDGRTNWNISKPLSDTITSKSLSAFNLALKKLEIENCYITYSNKKQNTSATIENLKFTVNNDFLTPISELKTLLTIDSLSTSYDGISYLKNVHVTYEGKLCADTKKGTYTFKENTINANALELGIKGWIAMPRNDISMDIKIEAKKTDFKTLFSLVPGVFYNNYENIKTTGTFALKSALKGTINSDKAIMPAFSFSLLVNNAMFQYPNVPKPVTNINLDLNIANLNGNDDNTVVDLKKLQAKFVEDSVTMILRFSNPESNPSLYYKLDGKIDLASLKTFIPIKDTSLKGLITSNIEIEGKVSQIKEGKYNEFKASGSISIKDLFYTGSTFPKGITIKTSDWEFTPRYVSLKGFESQIGKTDIKLNGKLENYIPYFIENDTLKGSFTLHSNLFDINELMSIDTNLTTASSSAPMDVVEIPKKIDFTMNTSIGQIVYDKFDIKTITGQVRAKESTLDFPSLYMNMLGGSLSLKGTYSTKEISKPRFVIIMGIKGFDIQKTITTVYTAKKLVPFAKNCSGQYSCDLSIASDFDNNMMPVYKIMNGEGTITTKDVIIKGSESIDKISELLKRDDIKELKTKYIAMQFSITNGDIEVKPFTTKLNNEQTTISGISYLNGSLLYVMAMQVSRPKNDSVANHVLDELILAKDSSMLKANLKKNIAVDILIDGSMNNPKLRLQLGPLTADAKSSNSDRVKTMVDEQKTIFEQKTKADADKAKADTNAKAKAKAEKAKAEAKAKAKADAEAQKKKLENEAKNKLQKLNKLFN